MDLTRAEGVADLISAQTDRALAQARALLKGELRERAHQIREALLTLRARIEVNIDFVEEDVPLMSHDVLIEEARTITLELEALAGTYELGRLVREGARIVIVGRPNAGKSSLFNALIKVDRAIVTDVAGTTRDTLEEKIDLGGIPVILVDTAGLRQTPELVEKLGVERTLEEVRRADLILHVIDGADPEPETPLLPKDLPIVTASSKADLERPEPSQKTHAFSSTTGEGLAELLEICRQRLGGHLDEGSGLILTRKRQQVAVSRAAQAISDAIGALKDHAPTELACVDIQEALDALAELVGTTSIEDVLDHLFSEFCIGK
jgi:tRNA modification GTPase